MELASVCQMTTIGKSNVSIMHFLSDTINARGGEDVLFDTACRGGSIQAKMLYTY